MKKKIDFMEWMSQLVQYADVIGWYIDAENPYQYKSRYDKGFSPEEVINDEISH